MQMRYRYRIEPTPAQQQMLARVFGCCRVVFNDALRVRDEAYRAGMKLSDSEIQRRVITAGQDHVERGWLAEVPSVALVQSVNDSRRAWRNFFDSRSGKRRAVKVGRPRMKSQKDHRQSFRLTRNGFSVRPNGRLFVAKVGEVRVRWSRELPSEPSSGHDHPRTRWPLLRQLRCRRRQRHRCRRCSARPGWMWALPGWRRSPPPTGRASTLRTRSTWAANCASCGGWSGRSPADRKDQNNRDKTRRKVAIAHDEVARARRDYHHKQALALVRENQVIHVEDLNIVGMVRNRRLARAISDAGWGQFVRIIGEKADRYGRTVHQVSRWLASSKTCSACGHRLDELPLQIRQWTCPSCGAVHDSDHNAAKVILAAGRAERLNACGAL